MQKMLGKLVTQLAVAAYGALAASGVGIIAETIGRLIGAY